MISPQSRTPGRSGGPSGCVFCGTGGGRLRRNGKDSGAKMNHYLVISPEMSEVIPIMDDGSGPLEYGCCVVSVEARTKREAKIAAIKHPDMQKWVQEQRGDNCNPFAGLIVETPVG